MLVLMEAVFFARPLFFSQTTNWSTIITPLLVHDSLIRRFYEIVLYLVHLNGENYHRQAIMYQNLADYNCKNTTNNAL